MAFRNRRVFLRDYSSSLAFFERLSPTQETV